MISIDKDACIACGACEAVCPHNFKLNDQGLVEIVSQDIIDCTREAEDGCPTRAIKIE